MANKWRKKLTLSDAQQLGNGALMPFLQFTKGNLAVDHTAFFRHDFFADLAWQPTISDSGLHKVHKETASIKVHVRLPSDDLGIRKMTADHDPARAGKRGAPTTHLLYDAETRRALESTNLAGHVAVVERDDSGSFSLTVQ